MRDLEVHDQQGQLTGASVRVYYAPIGPMPQVLTGSAGRATSQRIPTDAVKATEPLTAPSLISSGGDIQIIAREDFEGTFPSSGWTLIDNNSDDGCEELWDDDDYRPHNGGWAGWPESFVGYQCLWFKR